MVQIATPEQYFGSPVQEIAIREPIQAIFPEPVPTKIIEPVDVRYVQGQLQTDYMPLVVICFLGTICFLGFLAWSWKK